MAQKSWKLGIIAIFLITFATPALAFDFLDFSKNTLLKCVHPSAHTNKATASYLQAPQNGEYETLAHVRVDYSSPRVTNYMEFAIVYSYDHVKVSLLKSSVTPASNCAYLQEGWHYLGQNTTFPPAYRETKIFFDLAEYKQTIKGYEMFLAGEYGIPELQKEAIAQIYALTEEADLVEGYREFLRKYPDAPQAKHASHRLYAIAYAIAEEENTLLSYHAFLSTFQAAPEELRNLALQHAITLEEQELDKELVSDPDAKLDALHKELLIEKLGRRVYEEAIQARNSGDHETFIRKYNTLLHSQLFKETEVRFDLLRDQELSKRLAEILDEIRILQQDIRQSQAMILEEICRLHDEMLAKRQSDNAYFQEMIGLLETQQEFLEGGEPPANWDATKPAWINYVYLGRDVLEIVVPASKFIRRLSKIPLK